MSSESSYSSCSDYLELHYNILPPLPPASPIAYPTVKPDVDCEQPTHDVIKLRLSSTQTSKIQTIYLLNVNKLVYVEIVGCQKPDDSKRKRFSSLPECIENSSSLEVYADVGLDVMKEIMNAVREAKNTGDLRIILHFPGDVQVKDALYCTDETFSAVFGPDPNVPGSPMGLKELNLTSAWTSGAASNTLFGVLSCLTHNVYYKFPLESLTVQWAPDGVAMSVIRRLLNRSPMLKNVVFDFQRVNPDLLRKDLLDIYHLVRPTEKLHPECHIKVCITIGPGVDKTSVDYWLRVLWPDIKELDEFISLDMLNQKDICSQDTPSVSLNLDPVGPGLTGKVDVREELFLTVCSMYLEQQSQQ